MKDKSKKILKEILIGIGLLFILLFVWAIILIIPELLGMNLSSEEYGKITQYLMIILAFILGYTLTKPKKIKENSILNKIKSWFYK